MVLNVDELELNDFLCEFLNTVKTLIRKRIFSFLYFVSYNASHSLSQAVLEASLGMRQSPRGDREQLPTLGPSGRQERLNCCAKNLRQKVVSHFLMTSSVIPAVSSNFI